MDTICQKCLTSRSGDVLGAPCQRPGCAGVIVESPAFDTLVDVLPERMTCPRRAENSMHLANTPLKGAGPDLDYWQKFKREHGNRVCSYCGSLHPDDFFAIAKAAAEAPADAIYGTVPEVETNTKWYKLNIHQPGVRNASEGGIKFYEQHLEGMVIGPKLKAAYTAAKEASRRRFVVMLSRCRAGGI